MLNYQKVNLIKSHENHEIPLTVQPAGPGICNQSRSGDVRGIWSFLHDRCWCCLALHRGLWWALPVQRLIEDSGRCMKIPTFIFRYWSRRKIPFASISVAAGCSWFSFFLNTYIIITIIFVLLLLSYTTSWHWHQLAMCSLPKLADGVMKWLDKWWMQMCSSKWVRHVETTTLEIAKNRVTYCELRHRFIYHNRSGS